MVRKRRSPDTDSVPADAAREIQRLTHVAALLLVKGESKSDKIRTLAAVGYPNSEIASLLGLTSNAVNVALHRLRNKREQ